ncbi:hypothetical protein [Hoylesella timonensis]|uniref:Uncharacterized protein n=1 Tax=Hoylesella timonensis CRIS 5C-B1 TaxID=679189 RepID=D1VZF1_9BACT|nr:hypothetical protein [Hoylesella timonensis]EFA97518.1 hypothetical protein HMPREF9019_1884 [Hoylesella timonensis CRIS 5C-B1]
MNTKLQLFCAILLCFAIKWNAVFAAGHDIGIQKATTKEIKSDPVNVVYDAVATRSTTNSSEITELELSLVKLLLTHEGLGYPKANAKSRIALKNICDAPKKYTKDQLLQARQDFLNDTDVEMPVNGKRYTIKFYGIGQDVFLLDYSGGKVSTRKTTQGQLPDESACFTAHVLKNGRVAFETVDKKWLSYPTKTPGPSWLKDYAPNGVTDKLDEAANGLELQKAGKGEHVDLGNPLNLFGKFFIKSKRGTDANSYAEVQGYWLLNTKNNTFDGAGDPYYSEELSSVMLIEPVTKTTDIRQSERTLKRTSENKIYTLSGQRIFVKKLSDLPRGIYIVNGKKLLVQ